MTAAILIGLYLLAFAIWYRQFYTRLLEFGHNVAEQEPEAFKKMTNMMYPGLAKHDPDGNTYQIARSLVTFADAEIQLTKPELIAEAVVLRQQHKRLLALMPLTLLFIAVVLWFAKEV